MPTYVVTGPDGVKYRVTAPEGATEAQVMARVRAQAKPKDPNPVANTLGGLVKGVANFADIPYDAATGVRRMVNQGLGAAGSTALRTVGADRAADWWERGSRGVENDLARLPRPTSAITQVVPEPIGGPARGARFASELVGGLMVPFGPKAKASPPRIPRPRQPNPAQNVVDAGNRTGVRVLTTDVRPPRTFMGKTAQNLTERIPFAGTGGVRAAQQGERVKAVTDVAARYGIDDAGQATANFTQNVADDLAKVRGDRLGALTKTKDGIINKFSDPVPLPGATKAIDDEIARLKELRSVEYRPVIAKLEDWKQSLTNQPLRNVEQLRKQIGEFFQAPELAGVRSTAEKSLSRIYGPLRDDMGRYIQAAGGPDDAANWYKANDELSAMAGELNVSRFRNVLRNSDATPEAVDTLLFSQKPSEVGRLFNNLSPQGQESARSAILQRAVQKSIGAEGLSPDRFTTQLNRFGAPVKTAFANNTGGLDDVQTVLEATRRAGQSALSPPTGAQAVPYAIGAGYATLLGPVKGTLAAGATGGLGRLYESAFVRDALIKQAMGGQSVPAGLLAGPSLSQRLPVATSAMLGDDLAGMLGQSFTRPLAADEGEKKKKKNQR
jgi:hypothetical protein